MMMDTKAGEAMFANKDYQVHMLRIWREKPDAETKQGAFRASLEDTKTAVRIGFSDLDTLMEYLRQQTDASAAL
ncbi:MAG: hypothetical protein M5U34_39150 [Chloroflexi bacterium]|nr:hypothetical protein [Chloroflexota bacterium]